MAEICWNPATRIGKNESNQTWNCGNIIPPNSFWFLSFSHYPNWFTWDGSPLEGIISYLILSLDQPLQNCWWKKSCTSWGCYFYPIVYRVFIHPKWYRVSSINNIFPHISCLQQWELHHFIPGLRKPCWPNPDGLDHTPIIQIARDKVAIVSTKDPCEQWSKPLLTIHYIGSLSGIPLYNGLW